MFTLTTLSNKTAISVRYWLVAMALLLMCSASAPVGATDTPPRHDKQIAQSKETGHWNTDGHWYFFWEDDGPASQLLDYRFARGLSDLMLLTSRDSGWWINQNRAATFDELAAYSKLWDPTSTSHPPSACPQIQVQGQTDNSPSFNDPTNERVIVLDREGHVIRSFVILEKINPPQKLEGVLREDHQDPENTILLPFTSASPLVVLADCSLIMMFDHGIVRFDAQGQTQAVLPLDIKIVDGQVMDQLQKEFETSEVYQKKYEESLGAKLAFYYHKIFEGVKP